jgi:hypothetical protein
MAETIYAEMATSGVVEKMVDRLYPLPPPEPRYVTHNGTDYRFHEATNVLIYRPKGRDGWIEFPWGLFKEFLAALAPLLDEEAK